MSTCCHGARKPREPTFAGRAREILAWILPSAILALVPKCPACLAAHVTLWTGLGLSLSTATYLRWGLLLVCAGSMLFLIVDRFGRKSAIINYFNQEAEPCRTK